MDFYRVLFISKIKFWVGTISLFLSQLEKGLNSTLYLRLPTHPDSNTTLNKTLKPNNINIKYAKFLELDTFALLLQRSPSQEISNATVMFYFLEN